MTVLKSVKTTAGIALAALILAGCSSTSTTDSDDTMVDTTPVEVQPVAPVEVEDAFIIGTVLYFDFDKISFYINNRFRSHSTPYIDVLKSDNEFILGIEIDI